VDKLKELVVRIGDSIASPLERSVAGLADALGKSLDQFKEPLLNMVFDCVLNLPTKTPVYATLVGLLSTKSPEVGKEVAGRTFVELCKALKKTDFYNIKLLVRFVCELVNAKVLDEQAPFLVLEKFLSETEESLLQGRRDFFSMVVMQALPYIGHKLNSKNADRLKRIMDALDVRTQKHDQLISDGIAMQKMDKIVPSVRWWYEGLVAHAEAGWPILTVIRTPWVYFEETLATSVPFSWSEIEQTAPEDVKLEMPPLDPLLEERTIIYPLYQNVFRIFDEESNQLFGAASLTDIERGVIEDHIIDLIYFFNENYKDCVKHIINLPVQLNFETILNVVVETILSQLFFVPQPPFCRVYYGLLFAELCKASSEFAPGILSRAILLLYSKLETLDVECFFTFTEWFAHHLSNFEYRWVWSQWNTLEDKLHEDFIREVLFRCIRLSYHSRIEKSITPELTHCLPPEVTRPNFKYLAGPQVPGFKVAQQVYNKLNTKEAVSAIISWIESPEGEGMNSLSPVLKTDVLVTCLLQVGAKSFTYLLANLVRYADLFTKYVNTEETQHQAILSLMLFWKNSPHNIIITFSKLISNELITPFAVIEWFFSEENYAEYKKHWMWEILDSTIRRVKFQVELLTKDLQEGENPNHTPEISGEDIIKYRRTEEQLAKAQQDCKNLFILLFQRFEMVLRTNLEKLDKKKTEDSEKEEKDEKEEKEEREEKDVYLDEYWLRTTLGQFKALGRRYSVLLRPILSTLDILFSQTDQRITDVYQQFKALTVNY